MRTSTMRASQTTNEKNGNWGRDVQPGWVFRRRAKKGMEGGWMGTWQIDYHGGADWAEIGRRYDGRQVHCQSVYLCTS